MKQVQMTTTLTNTVQLGKILKDARFTADAVVAYRDALERGADPAGTNLQLIRALRMLGRKGEAVAALTAGLAESTASTICLYTSQQM